jgi:hypothetical protein
MKGTLEFNLPEEREDFQVAQDGWKYKLAMEEVWDRIFRPRHKHGYGKEIDELLKKEECDKLMDHLEGVYREIVRQILDEYGN